MKRFSLFRVLLCLVLILSLTFPSVYAEEIPSNNKDFDVTDSEFQIIKLDEFKTAFVDEEGNELRYNSYDGNFYYLYAGTEHLIEILDVSSDGVIHWQIASELLSMEGYTNTSGAPMPQMSVAIGAGTIFISGALVYAANFAAKVVIAGMVCYVGTLAYQAIKRKSNSASYYPAYNIFGTVYVATSRGLSSSAAVRYITQGRNVWAKSRSLARTACKKASPIGCAEWDQHGSTSDGYYPHYHAVRRYVGKNNYINTGAHCWYYA